MRIVRPDSRTPEATGDHTINTSVPFVILISPHQDHRLQGTGPFETATVSTTTSAEAESQNRFGYTKTCSSNEFLYCGFKFRFWYDF